MTVRLLVATGALLALAGCSATTAASKSATATTAAASTTVPSTTPVRSVTPAATTAAPTTKPKPVVWTVHEAGQHYLALVKPTNDTLAKLNVAQRRNDLHTSAKLAGLESRQDGTFIYGLTNGRWPVAARPQIKALIAAMLPDRFAYRDMSDATTWTAYNNASNTITDKSSVAAGQVRLALNLPLN